MNKNILLVPGIYLAAKSGNIRLLWPAAPLSPIGRGHNALMAVVCLTVYQSRA